jgi:hypothetical protein
MIGIYMDFPAAPLRKGRRRFNKLAMDPLSNCTVLITGVVEAFCFLGVNTAIEHGITVSETSLT